ncbi:MAG TPA: hypothetical protein VGM01_02095 [Ktedonobacteraceae bacterium]
MFRERDDGAGKKRRYTQDGKRQACAGDACSFLASGFLAPFAKR